MPPAQMQSGIIAGKDIGKSKNRSQTITQINYAKN